MKRATGLGWPLAAGGIVMLAALLAPDVTAGPFRNPWRTTTSVERLAKQLDHVERSLQYYGRVTVKAPDVWGQARLTAFRQEFEREMAKQLTQFPEGSVQANIAVTDQAFLSEAIALGMASKTGTLPSMGAPGADGEATGQTITTVTSDLLAVPNTGEASGDSKITTNVITRTVPSGLVSSTDKLTVEPEILLDQRKRYLDHLHQIRRINEGDDSVDAPGYALNLVRIPVSLIPGDKTRENYGAEVTLTVESHLSEELLASTFRELVINDLVDQLALPIVKIVEEVWDGLLRLEITIQDTAYLLSLLESPKPSEQQLTEFQANKFRALMPMVDFNLLTEENINDARTKAIKLRDTVRAEVEESLARATGSTWQGALTSRERRSRYAIPASQLVNVIGLRELMAISQAAFLARDRNACRDRLGMTDVQAFLRNELQAAFDFLNHSTGHSPDGVGSMPIWYSTAVPPVAAIRRVDREDLKSCRDNLYGHDASAPNNSTQALAWAILVESVLLNQQLNEDLKRVSQDPSCHCVPAGQCYTFYGPDPDPAAKMAFAEYVKCRWPVRVFALDPVTQQQNVTDAFSLRREMQVAIALAFSQRRVNAQSLTRYMRRIEQDIRTISLNQTVVGFGSGDDTFGWRFFPRVQTPGVESNLTVLTRDMLIGGPGKDAMLKQRRMEPGMRECVALVVMPSFVKHVRFDVRTNWFPLVPCHVPNAFKAGLTPPSMEQTVEWSRMIKTMEDSVAMCIQDEHLYRDGEVERMLKRAHQLSQELPINTMHAQVPYENTLGGFEMFSSGVTDLAPELVGFYGAPGINPDGDTELFLVGKNFSVTGTRVIAGNVNLSAASNQFSLLSRQVMQVSIPRGAQIESRQCTPRKEASDSCAPCDCNDKYVEIRLATPYGVSSPLLVPVVASKPQNAATANLSWSQQQYGVRYLWKKPANDQSPFTIEDVRASTPLELRIRVPAGVPVPSTAAVVQCGLADAQYTLLKPTEASLLKLDNVRFDSSDRSYVIELQPFIGLQTAIKQAVETRLKSVDPKSPGNQPYVVLLTATVTPAGLPGLPVSGELKIPITFTEVP
ncbi:hypothetical protein [Planctellipticum variicoloris]|uniref:hypothetical protein n=1 Tax=Planctellipticum variicoloris TaxID=3064265 RepID=UPI0030136155|nr:hypothetical protein SH412_003688 [Planctomycetaceae bacterium SH412]